MKKIVLSILLMLAMQCGYSETSAIFRLQATIENGCELNSTEQLLDFGRYPASSKDRVNATVINTAQSWNINCTQTLPVKVMLNSGDHFLNNSRRLKHDQQSEYVSYRLYQNASLQSEYTSGNTYSLTPTTTLNPLLNFSIYAVADLNDNNQTKTAGLYKDTVAITITW